MNKNPQISVIMPVYNGMPYLTRAIQSIQNQTMKDWELICVDDCSTDNSLEVMQKFAQKDKRIKVFSNKAKGYLSGSLNFALQVSHGKYIARMDADDISLPNRFEKQIELLKSNANLVAVGGWEEIIDEDGNIIGAKSFPSDSRESYKMLMNMMPIQPPLLMARAHIMKELKYDTGISKHDDIDMHLKLVQHGSFSNVNEIIFQYRKRMNSYTFSNVKKVFFMALFVRIRAIIKYGYRPTFVSILKSLCQVVVVAILPSVLIIKLFEYLRFRKSDPRLPYLITSPAINN